MNKVKSTLTLFLIAAILTVTILPANAQISIPKTREILSASFVKNDLKASLQKDQYNVLLTNQAIEAGTPFDNISKTAFPDPAPKRRAGGGKKWLWLPVLAGIGVGVYFIIKYRSDNPSGIRCVDGTYSQAQNRQGACSYHGGIAPGY